MGRLVCVVVALLVVAAPAEARTVMTVQRHITQVEAEAAIGRYLNRTSLADQYAIRDCNRITYRTIACRATEFAVEWQGYAADFHWQPRATLYGNHIRVWSLNWN